MSVIQAQQLSKSYGIQPILTQVSFMVNDHDKVGLLGPNGAGKTTLMRILVGELDADEGAVSLSPQLRLGYLEQNVDIESDKSVREYCLTAYDRAFAIQDQLRALEDQMGEVADDPNRLTEVMDRYQRLTEEFQEAGGLSYQSEVRGTLKGLGFEEESWSKPVSVLSGGEKSRLELARMLLGRPDILFLDEPTNHLDRHALHFLENFLQTFKGALMVISHDRYFLNKIVNRIFLIHHHKLSSYDCGYEEYTCRREKELQSERQAYQRQEEEIRRQKDIIDRLSRMGGSLQARGKRQAKSRQKLLDKMVLLDKPEEEEMGMRLRFVPKYESGWDVLEVKEVAKSFSSQPLFQQVSFDIHKGEMVGLIGENGIGKTTLFRLLLGKEKADEGQIRYGTAVKTAFFDQEQKTLHNDKTVIDELWDEYPRMDHYQIRSCLARFQFTGDEIFQFVGDLSGGERARLAFLKLMLSNANFLLLDEPTNHLDIESREILENALNDYEGTCFVISHDRYFLNHVCDHIFRLTPEGMECFEGNYDQYMDWKEGRRKAGEEAETRPAPPAEDSPDSAAAGHRAQKKRENARKKREQQSKDLEEKIRQLTAELKKLKEEAYDPAIYLDFEKADQQQKRIQDCQEEIDRLTDIWFELELKKEKK